MKKTGRGLREIRVKEIDKVRNVCIFVNWVGSLWSIYLQSLDKKKLFEVFFFPFTKTEFKVDLTASSTIESNVWLLAKL